MPSFAKFRSTWAGAASLSLDAPVAMDVSARTVMGLFHDGIIPVFNSRPALWPLANDKWLNVSLRYGNTEESALSYISFAVQLISIDADIPQALQFVEMAWKLAKNSRDLQQGWTARF